MLKTDIINKIKEFITTNSDYEASDIIDTDTDLIEAGILDSLLMVMLVSFCEEELGIEMDLDELTEDNFRSLGSMSDFFSGCLANQNA